MNLDGKYHLITELGQGGMAVVHLAVVQGSMGFRKLAVVKLLRSMYARDADFVEMFLQEARLCARLSHPNIVHTYEVGVDAGQHYLAMEFLDGVSLYQASTLARKGGPFTLPMQARVLLDVLDGLKYAHELRDFDGKELKIVHRDVSPHNVIITFDGQVKVLDFGIAKATTSSIETATGVIKGKLTYMAPEQARGDLIDGRADLHAVGVMLWEAVAGRRRWPADLPQPALFTKLASHEMPADPGAVAKGFPADFDRIALRGCDPRQGERYQSASDFHRDLELALRQIEPVSLREVGAMLREAFTEERSRLHTVIEQQVQEIAGDGAAHEVSTMRPPRRRGEQSDPSLAAASTTAIAATAIRTDSHDELRAEGATDPSHDRVPRHGPRSALRVGIIVAAMLAGVGLAMHQSGERVPGASLGSHVAPTTTNLPVPFEVPTAKADAARPGGSLALETPVLAKEAQPGGVVASSVEAKPPAASERSGRARERLRPALIPPSSDSLAPIPRETTPIAPALAADAAKAQLSEQPALRRPTRKAKVQLDEENPWL